MNKRIIANPPIGIYDNSKTNLGHSFFLVLLDSIVRYKEKFLEEKVIFPGRSYNFYGKKGDKKIRWCLDKKRTKRKLKEYHLKRIYADRGRGLLNLSNLDILIDDDIKVIKGIKKDILKLNKKGYLIINKEDLFLDCKKISKENNLKKFLAEIKFFPPYIKERFNFIVNKNINNPIKLTRATKYSVQNPLGGNNIAPIFILANLWDYYYKKANFTMACSKGTLIKYVLLRFLSQVALNKKPGFDEVILWPKLIFKENMEIEKLVKNPIEGDILRYSLLSNFSKKRQVIIFKKSSLYQSRKFIYKLLNLNKFFNKDYHEKRKPQNLIKYKKFMESLDYKNLLIYIEKNIRDISKKIFKLKKKNKLSHKIKKDLFKEYNSYLEMLSPFIPITYKYIKESKNVK